MTSKKQRIIAVSFATVGVISLVAAVLPALRGGSLNLVFLGIGLFWLVFSLVVWRKPDNGAAA